MNPKPWTWKHKLLVLAFVGITTSTLINTQYSAIAAGRAPQSECKKYALAIKPLAPSETYILNKYGSVTGKNYKDDMTSFNTINALLPKVNDFISKIEAITPSNSVLASAHQIYVNAWNDYDQAFLVILDAMQKQSYSEVAQANQTLSTARNLIRSFQSAVRAACYY